MGAALGTLNCTSAGAMLMVAAASGDLAAAQELLAKHPKASLYHKFKDKSSPLIQAAARGHFELLQLLLETAVMTEGPEKAKRMAIDHVNMKKQTALMVACKHGHPECVEYLANNGADPLICDERRQNTCLHLAALYDHSECVHRLLGARSSQIVQGRQLPVAQLPVHDDCLGTTCKFVNIHNGWGLTALHIAVFQGAVNTARVLMRHGASIETVICAPRVENSPVRCAAGGNPLHIAALVGNIAMARVILEAQEQVPGLELRSLVDSAGLRPQDYAQRNRNLVMVHLLDERLPVHLLRQVWLNYSLDGGMPARHATLASMLQKLKLMFNLEVIAAQRNISVADAMLSGGRTMEKQGSGRSRAAPAAPDTPTEQDSCTPAEAATATAGDTSADQPATQSATSEAQPAAEAAPTPEAEAPVPPSEPQTLAQQHIVNMRAAWQLRLKEIKALLVMVSLLHDSLQKLVGSDATGQSEGAPQRATTQEAILDFILSMLVTPRTVSAVLHSAKKLVTATVQAAGPGGNSSSGAAAQPAAAASPRGALQPPSTSSEAQHSMGLLLTALKAVETCLQAAAHLSDKTASVAAAAAPAAGQADAAAAATEGPAETSTSSTGAPPRAWAAVDSTSAATSTTQQPTPDMSASEAQGAAEAAPGAAPPPPPVPTGSRTELEDRAMNLLRDEMVAMLPATAAAVPAGSQAGNTSHWSAHLHTLLAQLQWDIGVQRNRRRRAHAAAAAARAAASPTTIAAAALDTTLPGTLTALPTAAEDDGDATLTTAVTSTGHTVAIEPLDRPIVRTSPLGHRSARGLAAAYEMLAQRQQLLMAAHQDMEAGLAALMAGPEGQRSSLRVLYQMLSRRGDAPQDVLVAHTPGDQEAVSAPLQGIPATTEEAGAPAESAEEHAGGARVLASAPVTSDTILPLLGRPAAAGTEETLDVGGRPSGRSLTASPSQIRRPASVEVETLGPSLSNPLGLDTLVSPLTPSPQLDARAQRTLDSGQPSLDTLDMAGRGLGPSKVSKGSAGPAGSECQGDDIGDSDSGCESLSSDSDLGVCAICMDLPVAVTVMPCAHGVCVQCALQLTIKGRELPSCPFCRCKISGFEHKAGVAGPMVSKASGGAKQPATPREPPLLALEAQGVPAEAT